MTNHTIWSADEAWLNTYAEVLTFGNAASPRGKKILEIPHHTIAVNMKYPVVSIPARDLNYRFMMTEALWILSGRKDVGMLTAVNKHMQQFSDDGTTLAGAYGPEIMSQINYVVAKLIEDRDTRQATMTLWKKNPAASKDIPCTVAMDFKIRDDLLNCHVFMRSSDVWLGLPYDIFAFSAVAHYVASCYNSDVKMNNVQAIPGVLYLTAASTHVYEHNISSGDTSFLVPPPQRRRAPNWELLTPVEVLGALRIMTETRRGDVRRWWERSAFDPEDVV